MTGECEILIVPSLQDHERAFFDSADWALGKVFINTCHVSKC